MPSDDVAAAYQCGGKCVPSLQLLHVSDSLSQCDIVAAACRSVAALMITAC
jgi:hypothetical protein